jgi:hypothetical protein
MPSVRGQAHASEGALERGGPRSRAGRTLERGGARSREAHPLERDGAFFEGGVHPRARRSLLEGIFERAALMGR